jgi:hypothetical protein
MKASITLDKTGAVSHLKGTLGIINEPYTACLELKMPDGSIDVLVVGGTGDETWDYPLSNFPAGNYDALIKPRVHNAFEATRLHFTL